MSALLISLFARWGLSQRLSQVLAHLAAAALVLALCAALWARGDHFRDQRDTAREKVKVSDARLKVSNASIDRLAAVIADLKRQADARAAEFAAAKQEAAADTVRLQKLARTSDERIAALGKLAQRPGHCAVPDDVRKLAEGL